MNKLEIIHTVIHKEQTGATFKWGGGGVKNL